MNLANSMNLSPTSFRRMLTVHGRSTTPGLLASPGFPPTNAPRMVEEVSSKCAEVSSSVQQVSSRVRASKSTKSAKPSKESSLAPVVVADNHEQAIKKLPNVNMPVSKVKEENKSSALDSYSFYKRPFRVQGNQAWEYAMRDLGSIDTLLNRYGYVEPSQRLEEVPAATKVSSVGDSPATFGATPAVATAGMGAGAAPLSKLTSGPAATGNPSRVSQARAK